jgi:hypothetical protein
VADQSKLCVSLHPLLDGAGAPVALGSDHDRLTSLLTYNAGLLVGDGPATSTHYQKSTLRLC